jgi:hypothetical protein
MLPKHLFQDLRTAMAKYYGICLTQKQMRKVLNKEPELEKQLIKVNDVETGFRGWMANAVAKFVGMESSWPVGSDSDAYAFAWFLTFNERCSAMGILLKEKFVESKFKQADND